VISSAVSWFNPVLIEVVIGLGALRSLERFRTLAAAVRDAIGIGAPIVLLPLGSLSQRPQIDDVSHGASSKPDTWAFGPDGSNLLPPITPRPWRKIRLA
jgi:hypothetical protein